MSNLFYELGRIFGESESYDDRGRRGGSASSGGSAGSSGGGSRGGSRSTSRDIGKYVAIAVIGLAVFFALPSLSLGGILVLVGVLALLAVLYSAVEIVGPYEKRPMTVFGEYKKLLGPGINVVIPLVSETHVYDTRTQMLDVPEQEAITRDNSPVVADAVIYIRVVDAEKAFLEVENYKKAVSDLAQTTLRAVLGDMELDDTLSKREEINARIREELDRPTDEWGVRVESVEVQKVMPSASVVNAMEKQTSAERRRRAMILEAQGERRAAVEAAEGEKQSNVIRAQGLKQSQILEAQGDAVSTVLRAKSSESMGERAVIEKGMETLQAVGEGDSNKFVLPQELTSLVGRYGKHLTGSDVSASDSEQLESLEFDQETEELLGLDDVDELLAQMDDVELDDRGEEREKMKESVQD